MTVFNYSKSVAICRLITAVALGAIFWPIGVILAYLAYVAYKHNRVIVDKFGVTKATGLIIPKLKFIPYTQVSKIESSPLYLSVKTSNMLEHIDISSAFDLKAIAAEITKHRKK